MAEEKTVLFRVTRERTTIFHPDRTVSLLPVHTGGEMELPESVALHHVKNGVGEIVETVTEGGDGGEGAKSETAAPRRPGRPAKTAA